ncbi:pyridoxal phosphate-dependent aminotransferase [Nonomuraea sp. LPB2021202275-12-8]|uniref:pyridoxal phosphate-dependent aminotransferase n=1 Tax=Nonomuraea sp. LPB2021202275-12-8 TaxID=3120159 RepID=UPI00300CA5E6
MSRIHDLGGQFGGKAFLDSNESPFGPPAGAIRRLLTHLDRLHRYPRGLREEVTRAVADHYQVDPASVLLTCGVDEATDLALSTRPRAWCVMPGFDGYADRARFIGRPVQTIALDGEWQPTIAPDRFGVNDVVFVAQPNNPTGNMFHRRWVDALVRSPALTFMDETYLEFTDEPSNVSRLDVRPDLVVFKSFSKMFGLAGLRVGAMLGHPDLIARFAGGQSFYSTDSVALSAILGALEDTDFQDRHVRYIREARNRYVNVLARSAHVEETRNTQANFVLARCRNEAAAEFVVGALADRRIHVRDCVSVGLPGWLRVSVGTPDDLVALATALSEFDFTAASPPVGEVAVHA